MFENLMDVTCECGHTHTLTTRDYIVERDALRKLPALLEKLGLSHSPLAVYDSNTLKAAHPKVSAYAPDMDMLVLEGGGIHPDEKQVEAITHACTGASVMLAVGSGVINDTVRYVGFQQNIPVISVPTAASVDGFVSNCSAMTFDGAKTTLPTIAPLAVVADLDIIAAAPKKLTASGVGDMLSKYISIADWHIGSLITGEYYCPFIAKLELDAVDLIIRHIDGIAAGEAESIGRLIEGLLISGIAIQMAGITRPASNFEHHFSHYLETIPVENNIDTSALHGEKVGVATVYAAKYHPVFARKLERIFREDLPNKFSMERMVSYYRNCPEGILNELIAHNTPTISLNLKPALLEKNYAEVLAISDAIPSPDHMRDILKKVGGMYDYRDIGMTQEQFRHVMSICCYVRNRFTLLRLMCDYELFDFDTMDD